MLVFTRTVGEEIVIGSDIRIRLVAVHGETVRLAVAAPPDVVVDRQEVHDRRQHPPGEGVGPTTEEPLG